LAFAHGKIFLGNFFCGKFFGTVTKTGQGMWV
jgi:hypothetical protein